MLMGSGLDAFVGMGGTCCERVWDILGEGTEYVHVDVWDKFLSNDQSHKSPFLSQYLFTSYSNVTGTFSCVSLETTTKYKRDRLIARKGVRSYNYSVLFYVSISVQIRLWSYLEDLRNRWSCTIICTTEPLLVGDKISPLLQYIMSANIRKNQISTKGLHLLISQQKT